LEIDTPEEGTVLWVHAPKHANQSWTFHAKALSAMEIRERTLLFSLTPAPFPGRLERKGKTLRGGGKIETPALLFEVDPGMPSKTKGKRAEGTVILGLVVDVNGYVASVKVLRGVDTELDQLAVEAMELRRYAKSKYRGRPVQVELTATIRFE
jgi:TonB family protein